MRNILSIVLVLVLLVGGAVYLFADKSGEKKTGVYDEFAQCIYDSGFRMYGSATCSFCEKQRKLFSGSEEYIREIECDPRNDNPQVERCIAKEITHTPTWIIEDEEGNNIKKFDAGVLSLQELSSESGCTLPEEV